MTSPLPDSPDLPDAPASGHPPAASREAAGFGLGAWWRSWSWRSWRTWLWQLPQQSLILLVKGYRLLLSPWLGSACRFTPTCSAYSLQALQERGAVSGTYLTLRRLVRCQPWCDGGHDPVPSRGSSLFSRLVTPVTSIPSKKTPS